MDPVTTDPSKQPANQQEETLKDAITAAIILIDYASEHGSDINEQLIKTIITSKHYSEQRALSEDEESEFWMAYHKLCIATAPVSRESLEATKAKPTRTLFGIRNISEANLSVKRYQTITIVFIFILLIFQVYWVFLSTLVKKTTTVNEDLIAIEANIEKAEIEEVAGEDAAPAASVEDSDAGSGPVASE